MEDLEQAKQLLVGQGYTCVLCRDGRVYHSSRRGVRPLLELLDGGVCVKGFSAADKVVGKATALLYCLLEVKAVYGQVMSTAAIEVLRSHGILAAWDTQTDAVLNHSRDGLCPMETAAAHTEDPGEALQCIRETLKRLRSQEN